MDNTSDGRLEYVTPRTKGWVDAAWQRRRHSPLETGVSTCSIVLGFQNNPRRDMMLHTFTVLPKATHEAGCVCAKTEYAFILKLHSTAPLSEARQCFYIEETGDTRETKKQYIHASCGSNHAPLNS